MKRWAFFPLLIAIHPVLASFAGPGKWQPLSDHLRPTLVLLVVVSLLWILLARLMRSAARAGFALSTFWFLFFAFGEIWDKMLNPHFWPLCFALVALITISSGGLMWGLGKSGVWLKALAIGALILIVAWLIHPFVADRILVGTTWTAITLICACWAGTWSQVESWVPALNAAAIGLIAIPFFNTITIEQAEHSDAAKLQVRPIELPTAKPTVAQPDVYQFILDGYGREDALERSFMFDNRPFVRDLEKRGFYVAKDSHSNYAQTEQSLSSELNAAYLSQFASQVDPSSRSRGIFRHLIADNAVSKAFESRGYDYTTISNGFSIFNRDSVQQNLSDPFSISLAEVLVLDRSPEDALWLTSKPLHQEHRDLINNAFAAAGSLPPSSKPRYVLVHILAPHPPFVFDRHGNPVQPPHPFGLWDADGFVSGVGSKTEYTFGYPEQLRYINSMMLKTVDHILAHSKTPSVIIIQGDHGSRREYNMADIKTIDPSESFENLMAVLGPPAVKKNLYPSISNVNVLPAILSGLFGVPFQKLPDRSYYSTWDHPFQYVDVTDRSDRH